MGVKILKTFAEIVDKAIEGNDVRCIDLVDNTVSEVVYMSVKDLYHCYTSNGYIFMEVTQDENEDH